MPSQSNRTPLVTSVAVKRPLSWGFILLLMLVLVLAVAAAGLAWHSEKQHRKARTDVRNVNAMLQTMRIEHEKVLAGHVEQTRANLEQQGRLDVLLGNDALLRQRWQAARTHEAITLAEQYLAIRHDSQAALSLLEQAASLISATEDPQLLAVRRALGQDIALLQALPKPDVTDIYQRLQALRKSVAELDEPLPAMPQSASAEVPAGATVAERWQNFLDRMGQVTSDLVLLRRHDQPLPRLLDSERRALVHEQMQLLLDQAQMLLLRNDELLFRSVLETLGQRLNTDFAGLPTEVLAPVQEELTQLQAVPIMLTIPKLNSRSAIDLVMVKARGSD